mmetsp:Transcript_7080/g.19991  ORF Transcript_7080/g.19991 Transcript_7080/m.19991 type:complete len:234 (+) Transcript_7080:323-1024(+)|eukprot:CAMPEP_0117667494 /NCGR_PEP_ID=MMETSP0804-20121206/11005_1 /TAXON_ID=1074897 /ORGANISM="Tetraselmis astigmatica, Strain CCMP880" /LENGTH=233 /DNA_ID=CAMNT_0005475241 /DNA_START=413 /DNA_END=1114 /DNA_ORIENTATION=+
MFKKLFGSGSTGGGGGGAGSSAGGAAKGADTMGAIQKLDETVEMLAKRSQLLQKKVDDEMGKARQYTKSGNKRAALMCLKNKKLYETQLEQVENNMLRVNEQKIMLENQRTTIETVSALKQSADTSKATLKEMKIEKVDQIFDDINEQNDQMREIQEALGQSLGPAADMDEDDLLAELEEMEAEQLDTELMEPAVPAKKVDTGLPSVPAGKVAAPVKTPEELELEALQAEMAL